MSHSEDSIVIPLPKIQKFCEKVTVAELQLLALKKEIDLLKEECSSLKNMTTVCFNDK